jgi:hypothetical protein
MITIPYPITHVRRTFNRRKIQESAAGTAFAEKFNSKLGRHFAWFAPKSNHYSLPQINHKFFPKRHCNTIKRCHRHIGSAGTLHPLVRLE